MFSSFRNRFGIPGVISVIALVFAMFGGAYAASNDSGSATASAKAKKGPRGPRGPAGPAGPQGPAGAKGDTGAAGANGKDGANGANGTNGAKGATGPTGPTGSTGATGATGDPGDPGDPWTAGGTLPSGAIMTGSFVVGPIPAGKTDRALISFPIPLAAEMGASKTHVFDENEVPAVGSGCEGGSDENPIADPGHLCIYAGEGSEAFVNVQYLCDFGGDCASKPSTGEAGASRTGALIPFAGTGAEGTGYGTWAVQAP